MVDYELKMMFKFELPYFTKRVKKENNFPHAIASELQLGQRLSPNCNAAPEVGQLFRGELKILISFM